MLVRFPQTLFVTEHYQLGRFGQVVASVGDRLPQPTNIALPGSDATAVQTMNDLNRIIVDDDSNGRIPTRSIRFGPGRQSAQRHQYLAWWRCGDQLGRRDDLYLGRQQRQRVAIHLPAASGRRLGWQRAEFSARRSAPGGGTQRGRFAQGGELQRAQLLCDARLRKRRSTG